MEAKEDLQGWEGSRGKKSRIWYQFATREELSLQKLQNKLSICNDRKVSQEVSRMFAVTPGDWRVVSRSEQGFRMDF